MRYLVSVFTLLFIPFSLLLAESPRMTRQLLLAVASIFALSTLCWPVSVWAKEDTKITKEIRLYQPIAPDALQKKLTGGAFNARLSQRASLLMAIYSDSHAYYQQKKYVELIKLLDVSEKVYRDLEGSGALWKPDRFSSKDDMKGFQMLFTETFRLRAKALLKLGKKDESIKYWISAEEIEKARDA